PALEVTAGTRHFTLEEENELWTSGIRPRTRVGCPLPNHVEPSLFAFIQFGDLLHKSGRLAEAITCWKRAIELDPTGNTLITTGFQYFQNFMASAATEGGKGDGGDAGMSLFLFLYLFNRCPDLLLTC